MSFRFRCAPLALRSLDLAERFLENRVTAEHFMQFRSQQDLVEIDLAGAKRVGGRSVVREMERRWGVGKWVTLGLLV